MHTLTTPLKKERYIIPEAAELTPQTYITLAQALSWAKTKASVLFKWWLKAKWFVQIVKHHEINFFLCFMALKYGKNIIVWGKLPLPQVSCNFQVIQSKVISKSLKLNSNREPALDPPKPTFCFYFLNLFHLLPQTLLTLSPPQKPLYFPPVLFFY